MTKMWGHLSFFTIKMLACGKIQIEQMMPHGLPRLVGGSLSFKHGLGSLGCLC
jgi:hypothetical protein